MRNLDVGPAEMVHNMYGRVVWVQAEDIQVDDDMLAARRKRSRPDRLTS